MAMIQPVVYAGERPGPRLIVLGAVHGNETCGARAIERVIAQLSAGRLAIVAGRLTLVPVANRKAYEQARAAATAT